MTLFTGTIPTIASGDTTTVPTNLATYRDALKGLSEAWTTYVPTWTTISAPNPAIGNGSILGSYARIDKMVFYRFRITMGTTTTYGTGGYVISLPVAANAWYVQNAFLFSGSTQDVSVGPAYPIVLNRHTTTSLAYMTGPSGALLFSTSPFTYATGDTISGSGMYEAA